jgi:hypothetical protein
MLIVLYRGWSMWMVLLPLGVCLFVCDRRLATQALDLRELKIQQVHSLCRQVLPTHSLLEALNYYILHI